VSICGSVVAYRDCIQVWFLYLEYTRFIIHVVFHLTLAYQYKIVVYNVNICYQVAPPPIQFSRPPVQIPTARPQLQRALSDTTLDTSTASSTTRKLVKRKVLRWVLLFSSYLVLCCQYIIKEYEAPYYLSWMLDQLIESASGCLTVCHLNIAS
jgi:hypothetical protein